MLIALSSSTLDSCVRILARTRPLASHVAEDFWEHTIRYLRCRLPLFHQKFEADYAVVADVEVVNLCGKVDLGLAKGIICREADIKME